MPKRRPPAWGKLLAGCLVLAALAAAWRYTSLSEVVTADNAAAWARRVRSMPFAPVIVVLSYTVGAMILFPRPLITLTAVLAFGVLQGTLYCAIGIMVAAMAFFAAGRFGPKRWVEKLVGDRIDALRSLFQEHGVAAIFALNMVPAPPFAVQGVIAGACRIPTMRYVMGSFLGMLPTLVGWAFFGQQLAASLEDPSSISKTTIAVVAAAMVAITVAVRRWFAKHAQD